MMTPEEEYARKLVATSGIHAAQKMNDDIFNRPDYRKWSSESVMLGAVCLAAGFARGIDLPKNDFLMLSSAAYDLVRSEEKKKGEPS